MTLWLSLAGDHCVGTFPKWDVGAEATEGGGCGARTAAVPRSHRPRKPWRQAGQKEPRGLRGAHPTLLAPDPVVADGGPTLD